MRSARWFVHYYTATANAHPPRSWLVRAFSNSYVTSFPPPGLLLRLIRHSAHSGTTQHGAQQPAAAENLRETNVEQGEENPKTSPENLINTFCGAP